MNSEKFLDNNFLMLKENKSTATPVATLHYERYKNNTELLEKIGFKFSEREFRVHCLLGNSQIITSLTDLASLSVWFDELYDQNQKLKFIPETTMQNILAKQWYDACGITNLGTKAFFFYFKSHWHENYPGSKAMLLSKCIIRWSR